MVLNINQTLRHFSLCMKPYDFAHPRCVTFQDQAILIYYYIGFGGPKNSPSTEVWKISFLSKALHI